MCEDVEALGGELEDDVPLRRLLWGPLVGSVLRSVEGDLVALPPAVVGEEAEDGVLLRVLHAFHVCRHVGDVDGVLVLQSLCGGVGFTRIGEEERRDGEATALHKTHICPPCPSLKLTGFKELAHIWGLCSAS